MQHDEALHEAQQRMAVLSDTKSFRLPLKEKPAVLQRNEMIRSRKYDKDDAAKFNALCRGESLLVNLYLIIVESPCNVIFQC